MTFNGVFLPRAIAEIVTRELYKSFKAALKAICYTPLDRRLEDPAVYMRLIILRVSKILKRFRDSPSMTFFKISIWGPSPFPFIDPPCHAAEWEGKR